MINQLDYLVELESERRQDPERLADIIIGVLALKEIQPIEPELAEVLDAVVSEVELMKGEWRARRSVGHKGG